MLKTKSNSIFIPIEIKMSVYTKKWRIYCKEPGDEGWQYVWWDMEPTNCPNSNDHDVNKFSVKQIAQETERIRLVLDKTVSVNYYTRVVHNDYNTEILNPIRRLKGHLYCDGTTTSYTIKLFDITNQTTLLETTGTNTDPNAAIATIGTIDSPPSGEFTFEIHVKRNNGTGNVYVDDFIIYSE